MAVQAKEHHLRLIHPPCLLMPPSLLRRRHVHTSSVMVAACRPRLVQTQDRNSRTSHQIYPSDSNLFHHDQLASLQWQAPLIHRQLLRLHLSHLHKMRIHRILRPQLRLSHFHRVILHIIPHREPQVVHPHYIMLFPFYRPTPQALVLRYRHQLYTADLLGRSIIPETTTRCRQPQGLLAPPHQPILHNA